MGRLLRTPSALKIPEELEIEINRAWYEVLPTYKKHELLKFDSNAEEIAFEIFTLGYVKGMIKTAHKMQK